MLRAQDIDAAYLFDDMGDLDDDLSSLLVPDLDFSNIAVSPMPPLPKAPPPVQTGGVTLLAACAVAGWRRLS
jgi:hypothetical protein